MGIGVWTVEAFLMGEGVSTHAGVGPILRDSFTWYVHPRPWIHYNAQSGSGGVAIGVKKHLAAASKREALHGVPDGIACIRISQAVLSLDRDLVIMSVHTAYTVIVHGSKSNQ